MRSEWLSPWMLALVLLLLPAVARAAPRLDVAAIYFPSYHQDDHYSAWFGEGWNEWRLMKEAAPRFPGHAINQPAWGYFDEADPAVMARQIDAAAGHGITVFIFDWYWYNGVQILQRPVEETLPKTPNRRRIHYALMWANHTWANIFPAPYHAPQQPMLPIRHSAADFTRVMDHCIAKHFRRGDYWRVGGLPFFSVFDPEMLIRQLGGAEATRKVLDAARAQAVKAGLPGVHFAAFSGLPESVKLLEEAGFDSLTSYNNTTMSGPKKLPDQPFEEYDAFAARHEPFWNAMDAGRLPYSPIVTAGWDVSPRWAKDAPWPPADNSYPYSPILVNNTPDRFEALCRKARAWASRNPKRPPAVFINSWNEWTEGGAILPGTRFGDGYLTAIRRAFGPEGEPTRQEADRPSLGGRPAQP